MCSQSQLRPAIPALGQVLVLIVAVTGAVVLLAQSVLPAVKPAAAIGKLCPDTVYGWSCWE